MSSPPFFLIGQRLQEVTGTAMVIAAGLMLIAGAAAIRLNHTAPLQARVAELRRDLANQAKPAVVRRRDIVATDMPPDASGLHSLYRRYPSKKNIANCLRIVYREAEAQGLLLAEGSYQLVPIKGTSLAAYQMSLPVKGSYVQVRQFVAQLLHALPAAAVDELQFSRDAITNAQLEAKIRVTLYLVATDLTDKAGS